MSGGSTETITAIEAAGLLARLTPGASLALGPAEHALLGQLASLGLVARAPDTSEKRAALEAKRAELAALGAAYDPARVRLLRTEILDLSESLVVSDGAAQISYTVDAGPYRGSAGGARTVEHWYPTQRGRALASNLAPRAARVPDLPLGIFEQELAALDGLFRARAARASALVRHLQPKVGGTLPDHALRSAMLGLASLPPTVEMLGDAFLVLFTAIRQIPARQACSPAQDASAAETLLLNAGDVGVAYHPSSAPGLVDYRDRLATQYCEGRSEDALDATLMLAAMPPEARDAHIARAARFATAMSETGIRTTLSLALLATVGGEGAALVAPTTWAYRAMAPASGDPLEVLAAALLAAVQSTHAVDAQTQRIADIHRYLARLAPNGMLVASAMLALLDGEVPGLLDDLRLAGRQIVEQGLCPGGAEATSLALKMLVHTALLARGQEGDAEERLALAVRTLPSIAALDLGHRGLGTAAATLPLLASTLVAFHRPVLDAAVLYRDFQMPMHSDSVFSGGWGSGSVYGSGGWGGGTHRHHTSYSHSHHRSFGWG
ncbi:MAG: hypothetical protein U0234_01520 [Sandaracinus sp.]